MIGVIGLLLAIYALIPSTESRREDIRKNIESIIAMRTAEASIIAEMDNNFHPTADFTSQENGLTESNRFYEYAKKTSGAFNLTEVYRLFKQYGTAQQQADLAER